MYRLILALTAAVLALAVVASAQADKETAAPSVAISIKPVLCTGIEERMPMGEAESFPADVGKVYLWTQVTGVTAGMMMIHHVWLRDGQEMADVELAVNGSPWRVYSFKTIPPEWAGNWEVKVVGPDGNVMKSLAFTVGAKAEEKATENQ